MKVSARYILSAAFSCALAGSAFARASLPGKAFVAQISGGVTYLVGGHARKLQKGDTVPVQGAHIATAKGALLVLVYSNGTSIFVDANTVLDVYRFVQMPFPSGIDTSVLEPSVSNTFAHISRGRVIISTNKLATGTTMVYTTPSAEVRVQGPQIAIVVNNEVTEVLMLTGSATVFPANAPPGNVGQALTSGQMAVVTGSAASTTAIASIQERPVTTNQTNSVAPLLAAAEQAQSVVMFQTVTANTGAGTAQEIQARAVVPANPPVQLTVSPSTLRSGG